MINQRTLTKRANHAAQDAIEYVLESFDLSTDDGRESALDALDDLDVSDIAHQESDSWDWVIYYHSAHQVCANCDTDQAEESFAEMGGTQPDDTYDSIATKLAYWVVYHAVESALQELIDDKRNELES